MSETIDLSGPLYEGMWSYNALPDLDVHITEFEVKQLTSIAEQGFESYHFALSSVTGTYLETGAHMLEGAPLLDDLPVSAFVRPAVVCHVPRKEPLGLIRRAELARHCPPIRPGDALLIDCGWGSRWRSADYVTAGPNFHIDCLDWLLAQPISMLGVDIPCIESARSRPDGVEAAGNMLIPLFKQGVLLLAPLINLDQIQSDRGELIALPLKVEKLSGAPCRAIFRKL